MPISLSSFLIPTGGNSFFLLEDSHVRGGFRVVESIAERDGILNANLKPGCLVYVQETGTYHSFDGLLSNVKQWIDDPLGGTGGSSAIDFDYVEPEGNYGTDSAPRRSKSIRA